MLTDLFTTDSSALLVVIFDDGIVDVSMLGIDADGSFTVESTASVNTVVELRLSEAPTGWSTAVDEGGTVYVAGDGLGILRFTQHIKENYPALDWSLLETSQDATSTSSSRLVANNGFLLHSQFEGAIGTVQVSSISNASHRDGITGSDESFGACLATVGDLVVVGEPLSQQVHLFTYVIGKSDSMLNGCDTLCT